MTAALLLVLIAWPVTALVLGLVIGRAIHACAGHDGVLRPGPGGFRPDLERRRPVGVPPMSGKPAV